VVESPPQQPQPQPQQPQQPQLPQLDNGDNANNIPASPPGPIIEAPKEPTPEPEPDPLPIASDEEAKKNRLKKVIARTKGWEYKDWTKQEHQVYESYLKNKSVVSDEELAGLLLDPQANIKEWKKVFTMFKAWTGSNWKHFMNISDIIWWHTSKIFVSNPQPNVYKEIIPLWNDILDKMAENFNEMNEVEGRFIVPTLVEKGFGTNKKGQIEQIHELLSKIEEVYHPATCLKIYMTIIEKTKSNYVKANAFERIEKIMENYSVTIVDSYNKKKNKAF